MTNDHVDTIIGQWESERPDLDVSGMAVTGRVTRLAKTLMPLMEQAYAPYELEFWEFDMLATLLRNGAPYQLTPGQLIDSMMITSGAMTNRIDRLCERGLVMRVKSPSDGRQVLVTLSDEGKRVIDEAVVTHSANLLRILEPLDRDQREQLASLLRTLTLAIESTPGEEEGAVPS